MRKILLIPLYLLMIVGCSFVDSNLSNHEIETTISPRAITNTPHEIDANITLTHEATTTMSVGADTDLPKMTPTPFISSSLESPVIPNIKIAFAHTYGEDKNSFSEIWIYESGSETQKLLHTTSIGTVIVADKLLWHPKNDDFLYYVVSNVADYRWQLKQLNIATGETIFVTDVHSGFALMRDWSYEGAWLSLYADDLTNDNKQTERMLIVNVETSIMLEITSGYSPDIIWSPNEKNLFVYYAQDGQSIVVNTIEEGSTINREFVSVNFSDRLMQNIFAGFRPNVTLAWNPLDNSLFVLVENEIAYQYLFEDKRWILLDELDLEQRFDLVWVNEQHYALYSLNTLLFMKYTQGFAIQSAFSSSQVLDLMILEKTLTQTGQLIISYNNKLWLVDLDKPTKHLEILDLIKINLQTGDNIDIWVNS